MRLAHLAQQIMPAWKKFVKYFDAVAVCNDSGLCSCIATFHWVTMRSWSNQLTFKTELSRKCQGKPHLSGEESRQLGDLICSRKRSGAKHSARSPAIMTASHTTAKTTIMEIRHHNRRVSPGSAGARIRRGARISTLSGAAYRPPQHAGEVSSSLRQLKVRRLAPHS